MAPAQKKFHPAEVRLGHKEGILMQGDGNCDRSSHQTGRPCSHLVQGSSSSLKKLKWLKAFPLSLFPLQLTWYLIT